MQAAARKVMIDDVDTDSILQATEDAQQAILLLELVEEDCKGFSLGIEIQVHLRL